MCVCPLVTKLLSSCDKECRNWLVLSCVAKLPPKPTAAGETWQSCRLRRERVLLRLPRITVAAGIQTDTAELVCTVTVRRSVLARRNRGHQREERRSVSADAG